MNINDIQKMEVNGDKLEAIFSRQSELEEKYTPIELSNGESIPVLPLDVNSFEGQRRIRAIIYRITEELYEAGNCLRNKAWKRSQVPTDEDHFLEELSDSFHFMIQLYLELGIGPEELCSLYFRKSEINIFRQKTNY